MHETPVTVGSLGALQAMIRGRILERTGGRIRGLRVEPLNHRIVVSGSAPTHHLHELVMAAIRESVCDSLIEGDRVVPVCMHVLMSAGAGPP